MSSNPLSMRGSKTRISRIGLTASLSFSILIDITAMADTNDQHDQLLISNCVNDTVVPYTDPIEIVLSLKLDRAARPRFSRKVIDASDKPLLNVVGKLSELTGSRRCDLDSIPVGRIGRHAVSNRFPRFSSDEVLGLPFVGIDPFAERIVQNWFARANRNQPVLALDDASHCYTMLAVSSGVKRQPSRIDSLSFVQISTVGVDMIKVTTSKARQEFARVLRKVKQGKRFLLERHNKGVAAIVSVEDLALLEAIENRHDLEEAHRAWRKSPRRAPFPGSKSRPNSALKVRTKEQVPDS